MIQIVDPGWEWDANFPLSQGLRIGDIVILSGQVALDENGNIIGKDDIGAQARQVFRNIEQILKQAGASLSDVVKLTTFFTVDITDKNAVGAYFKARQEFFGEHKPASTGVQVSALVYPELLLEVEAIAWSPIGHK